MRSDAKAEMISEPSELFGQAEARIAAAIAAGGRMVRDE